MPTPGLSLVGFIADQPTALNHLKLTCVPQPNGKPDAALLVDWQNAQQALGAPTPSAGLPALTPIAQNDPYIQLLLQVPWAPHIAALLAQGATFQMVEIAPLIAFQLTVDTARSAHHCGSLGAAPTLADLFRVCLPLVQSTDDLHASQQGQSVILKSRSLNLLMTNEGPLAPIPNAIGIQFAWSLPLVHVVRFGGRCYLHNGYHRAYGAAIAGAREIPCIFRDVAASNQIRQDMTIPDATLVSNDPPTMAHFIQGRALPVQLRATTRIIQVNWSQHTMYDE